MNNNYFGNGYMGQGMIPNQYQNGPKTGNWLSPEKLAMLRKGMTQFKLSVTEDEMAKGQCNHYDPQTGISALIPDQDGSGGCSCRLCGTHFNTKNYSTEEVHDAVQNILDILNTIKIMYLSIDPASALEYFQIIPFIEKIEQLYTIAINDFKKYEGVDSFSYANQANPFNIFSMMTNPGMGMGMMGQQMNMGYQQPMYGQQPTYGQQPIGMNVGMAQVNPGFNPMYGTQQPMPQAQQMGGYQPQTQGFNMNPMGAAAQQAYVNPNMPNAMNPTGVAQQPVAQPQAQTQVQQKPVATTGTGVTVDTKFKA